MIVWPRLHRCRAVLVGSVVVLAAIAVGCGVTADPQVAAIDRAHVQTEQAVAARLDLYVSECDIAGRSYVQFSHTLVDSPDVVALYEGRIRVIIDFSLGPSLTKWIVRAISRSHDEDNAELLRFALALAADSGCISDARAINDVLLTCRMDELLEEDAFDYYLNRRFRSQAQSARIATIIFGMPPAEAFRGLLADNPAYR